MNDQNIPVGKIEQLNDVPPALNSSIVDKNKVEVFTIDSLRHRLEAMEAALREIRDITRRRHAAVSWLQHKDGLEAIEAIVRDALGESAPDSGGKGAGG